MNTTLLHLLSRNPGGLFRGIVAILFGMMAFAWSMLTLRVLVLP
jgi:hypothetical protein